MRCSYFKLKASVKNANNNSSLPCSLESNNLWTIHVASDGSYSDENGNAYIDEHGIPQNVSMAVIKVVMNMSIGQKVMAIIEEENNHQEHKREKGYVEEDLSQHGGNEKPPYQDCRGTGKDVSNCTNKGRKVW